MKQDEAKLQYVTFVTGTEHNVGSAHGRADAPCWSFKAACAPAVILKHGWLWPERGCDSFLAFNMLGRIQTVQRKGSETVLSSVTQH